MYPGGVLWGQIVARVFPGWNQCDQVQRPKTWHTGNFEEWGGRGGSRCSRLGPFCQGSDTEGCTSSATFSASGHRHHGQCGHKWHSSSCQYSRRFCGSEPGTHNQCGTWLSGDTSETCLAFPGLWFLLVFLGALVCFTKLCSTEHGCVQFGRVVPGSVYLLPSKSNAKQSRQSCSHFAVSPGHSCSTFGFALLGHPSTPHRWHAHGHPAAAQHRDPQSAGTGVRSEASSALGSNLSSSSSCCSCSSRSSRSSRSSSSPTCSLSPTRGKKRWNWGQANEEKPLPPMAFFNLQEASQDRGIHSCTCFIYRPMGNHLQPAPTALSTQQHSRDVIHDAQRRWAIAQSGRWSCGYSTSTVRTNQNRRLRESA